MKQKPSIARGITKIINRTAVLAMTGIVGFGLLTPMNTAQAAPADCAKVELITFRGSGEDAVNDGDRSNGLSGPTLQRIIDAAREITTPGGYTLKNTKVFGVPYPAIPAEEYLSNDLDLFDSIEYGRLLGGGYIRKRHAECAEVGTRFILAGYSQGVLVARQVAADLPADWVAGVFGVGDPAQKGNAKGVAGSGSSGDGLYRWLIEKDGKASSDAFYDLFLPRYLYCHQYDPVCDFLHFAPKWPPDVLKPHLTYGEDKIEQTTLANKLVEMAATAAGRPPLPTGSPGPVDVMFAIDTTGSMTPYLSAAVDSAAQMAESLRTTSSRARVGLVEYRDYGDNYVARTVVALTDNFTTFEAGLDGLVAGGGGDTPEAVYTGIVTALGADWDRSASRALIVLGDAPAHDPELETGLTATTVAEIAKGTVPMPELPPSIGDAAPSARISAAGADAPGQSRSVPTSQDRRTAASLNVAGVAIPSVKVYGLSANSVLSEQLTAISTATGGQTLPISAPEDVTDSIIKTVEDAATAPIAKLTAADTVMAGTGTVLSGLGSSYSGSSATFGFDFDGNGTIDETTTEGAVTHTYPVSGPVTARLVVTDIRGRTSEATAQFEVRALDSLKPTSTTPPASTSTPTPTAPSPSTSSTIDNPPANAQPGNKKLAYTGIPYLPVILTAGATLLLIGSLLALAGRRRRRAPQSGQTAQTSNQ